MNFDASAAAKAENENKSLNINNNDDDDGGGGDDDLGVFDANLDDDVDEVEMEKEKSAEKKNRHHLVNNNTKEDVSPHDVFPIDIWRLVFAKLSPRETVVLGSACKMLYNIARAEETRNALFEKLFYRSSACLVAAEDSSSSSSTATNPPAEVSELQTQTCGERCETPISPQSRGFLGTAKPKKICVAKWSSHCSQTSVPRLFAD